MGSQPSWRLLRATGIRRAPPRPYLAGAKRLQAGASADGEPVAPERGGEAIRLATSVRRPQLDAAISWAKRLNKLLRRRTVDSLDDVLAAAAPTLFGRFAASLRRDFDAINAALVMPWTTSPVEGHVSRIKMLKRTMYGRAGFALLRARVLNAT